MKTLFNNAGLLLPSGNVQPGCVGVNDNIIEFVGTVPDGYTALRAIDCERNLLMPGFVNAHTHMAMSLFRGQGSDLPLMDWLSKHMWPLEDKLTADGAYWGTLLACAESIRAGVTSLNDMYMFSSSICEAIAHAGLRGLVSRAVVAADDDGASRLAEATALFEEWDGEAGGRIRVAISPHAEYTCTPRLLQACAAAAQRLSAPIHTHASETVFEHDECLKRHGKTPVALFYETGCLNDRTTLAHCVHVDDSDIELLAKTGAHAVHNPGSNLKLGSGVAPAPRMARAGINVALGTDGAASNNNLDMLEEMRLAALIHKGVHLDPTLVSAADAFAMATANGAKALGINAGKLEAGCLADLVLIDAHAFHMLPSVSPLSNIVYSANCHDVLITMVNGEILYERGQFISLDTDRIQAEVMRIMETF